ncbi:hypothetical protein DFH08DRAFT_898403 [Mycena albidolilacea]|uniref:Uncharacterized protein n=1 Tax=Mycena albidolilacea TaxID=1033008 RepID=A0AAD6Z7V0_9AGAR|nr:hypothetical protein DFH08DRAFT_898403 [Mycena albidolilacea]
MQTKWLTRAARQRRWRWRRPAPARTSMWAVVSAQPNGNVPDSQIVIVPAATARRASSPVVRVVGAVHWGGSERGTGRVRYTTLRERYASVDANGAGDETRWLYTWWASNHHCPYDVEHLASRSAKQRRRGLVRASLLEAVGSPCSIQESIGACGEGATL